MWHDFLQAFFARYEYPKAGAEYLLNLVAQLNEESSLRQLLAQKLETVLPERAFRYVGYGVIAVVLLLSMACLVSDSYNPFLYFRF